MLEKACKEVYKPFWVHAFGEAIELLLGVILCGVVYMLIIGIDGVLTMLLCAIAVWFLFFIKMFWIPFASIYERKKKLFVKAHVVIRFLVEEKAIEDVRVKENRIARLFPKELKVQRNLFLCADENDQSLKLRLIGSKRKMNKVWNHLVDTEEKVYITYGKYTKVILLIEATEDCANKHDIEYLNRIF